MPEEVTLELGHVRQTKWGQERGHLSRAKVWYYKSTGTFTQDQDADMAA